MITDDKVTEIYCLAADFCDYFSQSLQKYQLCAPKTTRKYHRAPALSDAEVITILVLFQLMGYRCLKHFYQEHVCRHMRHMFPNVVSYSRFVTLQRSVILPLTIFVKEVLLGKCTGITFVDSTPLRVCKPQRIEGHKVFRGIAARGRSTLGWFFGFKLHLLCNERGELLNFVFTPANTDDREPINYESFMKDVKGKLVGDKGYISAKLFERLFVDGIQLITKIRKDMKNSLMSSYDKLLLRKRAIIETINDELKNICQIEHSRHRSFDGFLTNLVAGLAAYCFLTKKPSINICFDNHNKLTLF
jgi:hypothetical protein